jgi:hypothetical protein
MNWPSPSPNLLHLLHTANAAKQVWERNFESSGDLLDVHQGNVALTTFDSAKVGPVEAAHVREFLLRYSHVFPPGTHSLAEPNSDVFHRLVGAYWKLRC